MEHLKTVAIFGGTFDPIHNGHLQSALELKRRLSLDELRLLPCHLPPHRDSPGCDSQQRLAMVRLAAQQTDLLVDDRELNRDQLSYSVDTLEQLRQEQGSQVALIWVMGADAFRGLNHWHRWRELLTFAHLIVIARPGEPLPEEGPVAELSKHHSATWATELSQSPAGRIWFESLTPYPISATQVRALIANHEDVSSYLPPAVVNYIHRHRLYCS
ncbi:MAG: nicotinate-nucleotide adenylyltransferase [Spongiibacteraceae bacterium]